MLRQLFFIFRYLFHPPWDTGQSPPELIATLETVPPGKALDLGCSTGTNALTMAGMGWTVTGVDFAPNAISAARRKARQLGLAVDFRVGDAVHVSAGAPFDLVLDVGCLHSLAPGPRARYIENLPGLLRVGGIYLLYANIANPGTASQPGLAAGDLELLSTHLRLLQREDGTNRGIQPSAWLTYRHFGDGLPASDSPENVVGQDKSQAAPADRPRKR